MYMIKETKGVKDSYQDLNENIMVVKDKQEVLLNYLKKRFQTAHHQQENISKELMIHAE